ncbi:MAG: hypothetical protein IPM45_15400 [Acidimicrobiales bacterium]|nr:hypothetical protein [Acidimicrobiales bacterium]
MSSTTSPDTPAPAPAAEARARRPLDPAWVRAAAVLSAGSGLVHAAAAGSHAGTGDLDTLFALVAVAQLGWALAVVIWPSRPLLWAGAALNLGVAAGWLLSRTTGIGFVDGLQEVEEVGTADLLATVLEAAAALVAVVAVFARPVERSWRQAPVVAVAGLATVLLAVPAMAAPHEHGGHSHDDTVGAGAELIADDGHTHTDGTTHTDDGHDHAADVVEVAAADGVSVELASAPGYADATADERAAAQALIDDTREALAGYTDTASVEADGFRSIGDGRTGFEHFVHHERLVDGEVLSPDAIESIVFQVEPDGTETLVSGMYILENGATMDDVPEVAGPLTVWHDHQNLCWDGTGTRVVGLLRDGACVPGGTLRATAPMLHVWVTEQACGPFAGIEGPLGGHGEACAHDHGTAATATAASSDGATAGEPLSIEAAVAASPGWAEATTAQRDRALALTRATDTAIAWRFADTAAAEAAGYRSIGDGRTGYEHYINLGYIIDAKVLDPATVESLVYEVAPDGSKRLVSGMYILAPGQVLGDEPDVGGPLTAWHDHQNLCWDPNNSGRLAGVLVDGRCVPGGVLRPTPPMLHVWVVDNPCGRFAGIEGGGHGDSCEHSH